MIPNPGDSMSMVREHGTLMKSGALCLACVHHDECRYFDQFLWSLGHGSYCKGSEKVGRLVIDMIDETVVSDSYTHGFRQWFQPPYGLESEVAPVVVFLPLMRSVDALKSA